MKAVILAGGFGTRISEETSIRPKPMIEIGPQPILWHIMKNYSQAGINEFIICCGYKGHVIKDYFANYFTRFSDITFDLSQQKVEVIRNNAEPWKVSCVDTGEATMTGGRLKRVLDLIGNETFCMTYGDGVSNVPISELVKFHQKEGRKATLTAVQPSGRFGAFTLAKDQSAIESFQEKPKGDGAWVNGGFFVLEPSVGEYISDDSTVWEREPMETLARNGELSAYKHAGFWQPMDTLRDKNLLEELWAQNKAPWKTW